MHVEREREEERGCEGQGKRIGRPGERGKGEEVVRLLDHTAVKRLGSKGHH
jgi:hypothetical protein